MDDKATLDEIAKGLSEEEEWNADTLAWVAELVERSGREITYPEYEDEEGED
jgi:hypothetical protein